MPKHEKNVITISIHQKYLKGGSYGSIAIYGDDDLSQFITKCATPFGKALYSLTIEKNRLRINLNPNYPGHSKPLRVTMLKQAGSTSRFKYWRFLMSASVAKETLSKIHNYGLESPVAINSNDCLTENASTIIVPLNHVYKRNISNKPSKKY